MTLGIAVVYLFDETYLPLFEMQIARLRRHTKAPFRIYAACNRLPDSMRAHVDRIPEVVPIQCRDVDPDARGREEHAACQRELTHRAFADGCDMVAMLHLDSFPITDDWDSAARAAFDRGARLVTVGPYCYTAGLFVTPDSFGMVTGLPSLIIDDTERASQSVQSFLTAHPDLDAKDSGIGWLHALWADGAQWEEWRPAKPGAQVFGTHIFHLVAGTRLTKADYRPFRKGRGFGVLRRLGRMAKPFFPQEVVRRIRYRLTDQTGLVPSGEVVDKGAELRALLSDPDRYIAGQQGDS